MIFFVTMYAGFVFVVFHARCIGWLIFSPMQVCILWSFKDTLENCTQTQAHTHESTVEHIYFMTRNMHKHCNRVFPSTVNSKWHFFPGCFWFLRNARSWMLPDILPLALIQSYDMITPKTQSHTENPHMEPLDLCKINSDNWRSGGGSIAFKPYVILHSMFCLLLIKMAKSCYYYLIIKKENTTHTQRGAHTDRERGRRKVEMWVRAIAFYISYHNIFGWFFFAQTLVPPFVCISSTFNRLQVYEIYLHRQTIECMEA